MNSNENIIEKIKKSKWYNNYADFIFFLVCEFGKYDFDIFDVVRVKDKNSALGKPFVCLSTQKLKYYYFIQVLPLYHYVDIYDVLDILRSLSRYLQLDVNIPDGSQFIYTDCTGSDINAIRENLDPYLPERLKLFRSACRNVVDGIRKKFKTNKKRDLSEDELFELIQQTDMYKLKFEQKANPMTEEEKQKLITLERNVLKEIEKQEWYICRSILIKEALSGEGHLFFKREEDRCCWVSFDTRFAGSFSTDIEHMSDALYDLCATSDMQVIIPTAMKYNLRKSDISVKEANENIDKLANQMNELIKILGKALSEECKRFKEKNPHCSDDKMYDYIISKTEKYSIEMPKAMKEYPEKERQKKIAEEQKRMVQKQKEEEEKERKRKEKEFKEKTESIPENINIGINDEDDNIKNPDDMEKSKVQEAINMDDREDSEEKSKVEEINNIDNKGNENNENQDQEPEILENHKNPKDNTNDKQNAEEEINEEKPNRDGEDKLETTEVIKMNNKEDGVNELKVEGIDNINNQDNQDNKDDEKRDQNQENQKIIGDEEGQKDSTNEVNQEQKIKENPNQIKEEIGKANESGNKDGKVTTKNTTSPENNSQLNNNENQAKANNEAKEKNESETNERNGNTVAKAFFAIFLVASVAFGVTGAWLNPWLLLGLVSLVPTGIFGYFGFKTTSKPKKINLGGSTPVDGKKSIMNSADYIKEKCISENHSRDGHHKRENNASMKSLESK